MRNEQKKIDWPAHIARWKESGLTQAEYCRQNELRLHAFGYWKRKYAGNESEGPSFVALGAPTPPLIELRIHKGLRVEVRLNIQFTDGGLD